MSDEQRKGSTSVTELPNPDLNPLLNPTLGRNLGRWAEVYFTNPPEKREAAVEELLRELEGTPRSQAAPEPTAVLSSPPSAKGPACAQMCPDCGQVYEVPQRFCGMCGMPLPAPLSQHETRPLGGTLEVVRPETALRPQPVIRSLASFDTAVTDSESPPTEITEIRWLRETRLRAGGSGSPTHRSSVRRYATVALALFAIAALVYMQARSKKALTPPSAVNQQGPMPAASRSRATANPPARVSVPPAAEALRPQAERPKRFATQAGNSTPAPPPPPPREFAKPQPSPVALAADTAPPQAATPNPGNGSAERAQAEDYLNGKNRSRDAAAAARLLWIAVGKENTSAILLLSDMYLIGDGVPKSCDQAKVLLYAAARKHIAQAADKLRNLEQSGCP